jgi:calcium/proton exchanger cax
LRLRWHYEQHFNAAAARSQATMLLLAAIGLVLPAAFRAAAGATEQGLGKLSVTISVVLLLVYLLYLVYVLVTHSALFSGPYHEEKRETEASVGRAALDMSPWALANTGIAIDRSASSEFDKDLDPFLTAIGVRLIARFLVSRTCLLISTPPLTLTA